MIKTEEIIKGFKTPEARWARFGPYYAMFPVDFAFKVIEKYSKEGDFIIQRNYFGSIAELMPLFYRMCYCHEVLKFLLSARQSLDWKNNNVDATLMSILLVYLHGKLGEGLSNQMKMSKAMGMNYSVEWWRKHNLSKPPEIIPIDFIIKKIQWRYEKGKPNVYDSRVIFRDSTVQLPTIVQRADETGIRFSLLFTSPPYCSVTDYHADQWLRLWLLGETVDSDSPGERYKGRFVSKEEYYLLLNTVFGNCSHLMDEKSTIYIRTDKRQFTLNTTKKILRKHFPNHRMRIADRPFTKKTQTEIHGNTSTESGEVDIIMIR